MNTGRDEMSINYTL